MKVHVFFLETVLDNEAEPESTLDLGCGIGPIALILMEYWKHTAMTMIDVNQKSLSARRFKHEKISS